MDSSVILFPFRAVLLEQLIQTRLFESCEGQFRVDARILLEEAFGVREPLAGSTFQFGYPSSA